MLANTEDTTAAERAQRSSRLGDALLLGLAAAAAAASDGTFHWRLAIALFAASATLWLFAARVLHQYDAANGRGIVGDLALTAVVVASVVGPMAALCLLLPSYAGLADIGRFTGVLLPAVLLLRVKLVGLPLWRSRPTQAVLVVGVGPLGRLTGMDIVHSEAPRTLVGYLRFDDERGLAQLPAPDLGAVRDLETALRTLVVDEVYIASTATSHHDDIQATIRTCERLGVPFAVPACAYRLTRAQTAEVGDGYTHFTNSVHQPVQRALKRAFDILAPAAALVALSPLLIVSAVMVKLTSKGPVLFRQERVGLLGRKFSMLKFRSMVVDAEERKAALFAVNEQNGPVFKMKRDPRVTAVGRFLRKYSIDELPQLVNVLRGDMSIVGPRPPLATEVAKYEGWQRRRLSVRPGLTCVWQVSGRNEISFEDWMLLDMRYIDHWSLFADFDLIARTVPVVLTGRGAS